MTPWVEPTLMACGVVLAAFFAGSETGAYVLNRLRLRYRASAGVRRAALLQGLLEDMPGFVTALLIWTNLSVYLVSAACTSLFERAGTAAHAELAATLAAAPVLFVFSELAPKELYRRRAEGLMLSEVVTTVSSSPDLELAIEDLDLSERPRNCLKRAQVNTVGELLIKSEDDLLAITNFGQKSLDEVIEKLDARGLSLHGIN